MTASSNASDPVVVTAIFHPADGAHDALVASDFFAPHIPEQYGGVGADALATCIVIEEVARLRGYEHIPSVLPVAPGGRGLTRSQRGARTTGADPSACAA